eukprot:TRINITY_DN67342_c0_g2_i1.p1 TRINITY_DN67342_c0_g2~~TRINITY_DN67342_c0_g2_i1.p1  ORF type:complete len:689 (+),score=31.07 TRINITY_DN67342_c0_g2_i1:114-2180(+)
MSECPEVSSATLFVPPLTEDDVDSLTDRGNEEMLSAFARAHVVPGTHYADDFLFQTLPTMNPGHELASLASHDSTEVWNFHSTSDITSGVGRRSTLLSGTEGSNGMLYSVSRPLVGCFTNEQCTENDDHCCDPESLECDAPVGVTVYSVDFTVEDEDEEGLGKIETQQNRGTRRFRRKKNQIRRAIADYLGIPPNQIRVKLVRETKKGHVINLRIRDPIPESKRAALEKLLNGEIPSLLQQIGVKRIKRLRVGTPDCPRISSSKFWCPQTDGTARRVSSCDDCNGYPGTTQGSNICGAEQTVQCDGTASCNYQSAGYSNLVIITTHGSPVDVACPKYGNCVVRGPDLNDWAPSGKQSYILGPEIGDFHMAGKKGTGSQHVWRGPKCGNWKIDRSFMADRFLADCTSPSASCTTTCIGNQSCEEETVLLCNNWDDQQCATQPAGSGVACAGNQCRNMPQVATCTQDADGTNQCVESTSVEDSRELAICPEEGDCNLYCDECHPHMFLCPRKGDCTITVNHPWVQSGTDAFTNMRESIYRCPTEGKCTLKMTPGSHRTLAQYSMLQCPVNGDCEIDFTGIVDTGLYSSGAVVGQKESGNLSIRCVGKDSCSNDASVYCPENGDCRIECTDAATQCQNDFVVWCPRFGKCEVLCSDVALCQANLAAANQLVIKCPLDGETPCDPVTVIGQL